MHRRIAPLLLALLVALPVVAPAAAAEPPASPPPDTAPAPLTQPAPSTDPAPTPDPAPPATDPAPSPDLAPPATDPTVDPAPAVTSATGVPEGAPDPTGRFIVMLRSNADTGAVVANVRNRDGITADRSFGKTFHGFAAKLDHQQKRDLLADPNVIALVPDGVIQLTQTVPTGVARVGGRRNTVAAIDGTDRRIDADVAIVDTGIAAHPDLNVAGGYNCSTADRTAWRDKNNHGTHVAGIVAALDNSYGVVGVAPGARVWGVKILNDDGYGLVSWYICGLDWILAQRDPVDPSRPLFEAVNMSVTKYGKDDHNCGNTNNDPLHQAICRVVAGGITVVAAAANDSHSAALNIPASYDEVITVSALADTDGKPGGLGGNRCYSWGGYDKDDTFADFSNYGGDVDLIAPGKCIMSTIATGGYAYMSGTSMAAPTVTGAVALYKSSRPNATPAEVREALRYLGNLGWKYWTDPDATHEPLLDVSRIGPLGTFALTPASATTPTAEGGTSAVVPFTLARSGTFFERVKLSVTSLPDGWTGGIAQPSMIGWTATAGQVIVTIPKGTALGTYHIGLEGTNEGRTVDATISVNVVQDDPTATPPTTTLAAGTKMGLTSTKINVQWAATDPTSAIAGYELEQSVNEGAWGPTLSLPATTRSVTTSVAFDTNYRYRVRAVDAAGHWSPWAVADTSRVHAYDDRSSRVLRTGSWHPVSNAYAFHATLLGASKASATVRMTFTGHSVAVVGPKSRYRGRARLYIDGVLIGTLNMKSASALGRQVVFSRFFADGGTHTIMLRPTGTGAHRLVRLDAIVVGR